VVSGTMLSILQLVSGLAGSGRDNKQSLLLLRRTPRAPFIFWLWHSMVRLNTNLYRPGSLVVELGHSKWNN